jgi:hypothetical protein
LHACMLQHSFPITNFGWKRQIKAVKKLQTPHVVKG